MIMNHAVVNFILNQYNEVNYEAKHQYVKILNTICEFSANDCM